MAARTMDQAFGPFVAFRVDELRFALPLAHIERVIRSVAVTPLPDAPPLVMGIVNAHGTVLPVLNMRRKFQQRDRDITPDDHFVLAHTARGRVLLAVDEAEGVIQRPPDGAVPGHVAEGQPFTGLFTLPDGLVLIYDLDTFLSADDTGALAVALSRAPAEYGRFTDPPSS